MPLIFLINATLPIQTIFQSSYLAIAPMRRIEFIKEPDLTRNGKVDAEHLLMFQEEWMRKGE